MKIVYHKPSDVKEFDIGKYYKSLNRYGKVEKSDIEEALKELPYDPMHYSVLVSLGVRLLPDDESARAYYDDHVKSEVKFERLRRITGYLVGSLERWNDGKKAEEKERVKHDVCLEDESIYSVSHKDELEAKKAESIPSHQDEYQKGN